MSGGGGGEAKNAQRRAEQLERERQAAIAAGIGRVNSIYDDPARVGQYDQLRRDTLDFHLGDLNKQKASTDRNTRFALARNGQVGGSLQTDTNRRIGEEFLRGTIEADRRAQGAAADLRMADEQSRMNLISMVQGGLDSTTASSQAAASLQNNLLANRASATANGIGDIFGGFSDLFRRSQERAAERRGERDLYNLFYQPGFGQGGP